MVVVLCIAKCSITTEGVFFLGKILIVIECSTSYSKYYTITNLA